MYKYKLFNNHYIITINNKDYLLDTGNPFSMSFDGERKLKIDDKCFYLSNQIHQLDIEEIYKCIGMKVNGFIGLDIINETSLTIYKDGNIDFKANKVDGKKINMSINGYLKIKVGFNLMKGDFIIDTGAKYGYGVKGLFYGLSSYQHVKDYNPILKSLDSDIYHLNIAVGGMSKTINVCYNQKVGVMIKRMNALMIGNITNLFNEVCVFDIPNKQLVIK